MKLRKPKYENLLSEIGLAIETARQQAIKAVKPGKS